METKVMEWQPIETAPKDGSTFLGYMPPEFIGGCNLPHHFATIYYDEKHDAFWTSNPGGYAIDGYLSSDPTHWMPLPEPPK